MKDLKRTIGTYTSGKLGPLLFVSAGVHGNEPSGVQALQKVFADLEKVRPEISGMVVGVVGNRRGLDENVRYVDEDLNRAWTEENVALETPETYEQSEMREIISLLERYPEEDFEKRIFLDCHTTSSATLPYISVQEVNDNDEWAHQFPTYIIRGFSDLVYGCIDHYLSRIGITGFVFEAGQHTDPKAVENHEGIIWLALEKACGLDLSLLPDYPKCVDTFAKENAPEQKTFEILHRHGLEDGDEFSMEPGFSNFDSVKKGQLLATHNGEEIRAERDAFIFMPLYQAQGNDGFFLVEAV